MIPLRVLAAMSGGVDSAVAAALAAEEGHEVTGVTLRLACYGATATSPRACCTLEAIDDARRTAMRMGFPHHVIDAEAVFRERVLMPFANGYAEGRTPYPCAACNEHLKFGDLVARMEVLGAQALATGHYARVVREADGGWGLHRAADPTKDQSYALALIPYSVLERVIFPLGELPKAEVRAHGRRLGLPLWDKPESQDLCFVPDGDYAGFAIGRLGETRGTATGRFVDGSGRTLGTHRGILHYTVGQRRGLGLATGERLYVIGIDPDRNSVTVGPRAALAAGGLETAPANWLTPAPPAAGSRVEAKFRSQHAPVPATLEPLEGGRVRLSFDSPQSAVAPGQLAAWYAGDRLLGGAPIERALPAAA